MTRAPQIAFILFLMVNATLFIRPAELIPALAAWPIYEAFIVGTALFSLGAMRDRFRWSNLKRQPISLCAVGLLAAIPLSHVMHMYLYGIQTSSVAFLKTLIYYALLISIVDSPQRLRTFIKAVAVFASVMISLCVTDYLGVFDFQFIEHISDRDGTTLTGDVHRVFRMRGTGIFHDPNDISILIVAAGILCAYFLFEPGKSVLARCVWAFPILWLMTGLLCTRSRGGLLALAGALFAAMVTRYGRKMGLAAGLCGLLLLPMVAGRQGDIDLEGGTGQARILLWRDGFQTIKSADFFFGIGHDLYAEVAGLVAHNSFVHAYVELGIFGGTLFFGCYFFAFWGLYRLSQLPYADMHPDLVRFRPYMAALLTGWGVGLLSLSRCYVVPTYLILGLAACYLDMAGRNLKPARPLVWWDRRHAWRLATTSMGFLFSLFVVVLVFAR
ncbi:MAG: O-antigen ligase family protein [Planctomycetaceae bacterium]